MAFKQAHDNEIDSKNYYLSNLGNEKSGEQLESEQRNFRQNEAFIKCHEDIKLWFKSPPESRQYSKSFYNNKNVFCKRLKNIHMTQKLMFYIN